MASSSSYRRPKAAAAAGAPKKERHNYVALARAAKPIEELPPRAEALARLRLDPDDPDARVPEPSAAAAAGKRRFLAYSYQLYLPGVPPHAAFEKLTPVERPFDRYESWLQDLVYRSLPWDEEHGKFCTGSTLGAILGQSKAESPEKTWYRFRFPDEELETDYYGILMKERGVQLEVLHGDLLENIDPEHEYVCKCPSQLHPRLKWAMATPDAKVYEREPDGSRGRHVRDCEFKTPWSRPAACVVDPEHMAQVQWAMFVDDEVREDDYSSLRIDDATGRSEWVVTRVRRSKKYIEAAMPVALAFIRAVLTGARPPPRGAFKPPRVKTAMVLRATDALQRLPGWQKKLSDALVATERETRETLARNKKANALLSQTKLDASRAAEAALRRGFEDDDDGGDGDGARRRQQE